MDPDPNSLITSALRTPSEEKAEFEDNFWLSRTLGYDSPSSHELISESMWSSEKYFGQDFISNDDNGDLCLSDERMSGRRGGELDKSRAAMGGMGAISW